MAATSPHTTSRLFTYVLTSPPSNSVLIIPLPDCEVRPVFLISLGVSFSPFASPPKGSPIGQTYQSLRDPMALSSGHFLVRTLSLGDAITRLGRSLYRDPASPVDQSIKPCNG